jgi:predicted nuclease of predicted toxin-antitoxin system
VKLLLDGNLPPRLVQALADLFPGSLHLRECGLRGASDLEVWQYAAANGFAIVSKDSDFWQRSLLLGSPPKVIWLRIGNCTTSRVDFILRNAAPRVLAFESSEESCLVLAHSRNA